MRNYKIFTILTSFGCPYKCTFCNSLPVSPKKIVYRDLDEVIKEIRFLKKIKKKDKFSLLIADEAFIINRERVIRFCGEMRKMKVGWACYGRIDRMDEPLLRLMSKSGCEGIFYGIESGSNRILKKIKKGFEIQDAIKILLLSRKYVRRITASFIYMYPFETFRDCYETLINILYIMPKDINAHLQILRPVKGSELYINYAKRLFFTPKLHSDHYSNMGNIPESCVKLIRENPHIFYYHYFYYSKDLHKLLKLANNFLFTKWKRDEDDTQIF